MILQLFYFKFNKKIFKINDLEIIIENISKY